MPLVMGAASSHAPCMFAAAEEWAGIHRVLAGTVPQPLRLSEETPEVIKGYIARIAAGFDKLAKHIADAKLDALLILGDDQTEIFSDACVPAIAIYIGAEMSGSTSITFLGQSVSQNHIKLRNSPKLARAIVTGLMDRGFDPAHLSQLVPMGKPATGLGHAFTRVARATRLNELGTPVIPMFINSSHAPLPSGGRCYALGRALADIFVGRPERIGIYGSGGLSHDPLGQRAGWVDEPLDRWFLDTIARGEARKLATLFSFDSDALRGGTGELRSWIATAAALEGTPAEILDYIPAIHAVTGLGFACWPDPSGVTRT
jgi:hypothetical protein